MRIFACMMVVVVGVASGQQAGDASAASATNTAGAAGAGGAAPRPTNPYGPAFYGPGLNNPAAQKPDPIQIQNAQRLLAGKPEYRVRVGVVGGLTITDRFGQEIKRVINNVGLDVTDQFRLTALQEHALELQEQREEIEQEFLEEQQKTLLRQSVLQNQKQEEALLRMFRTNPNAFNQLLNAGGPAAAAAAPVV